MLDYPIREGLLSYIELLKEDALEDWRVDKLAYQIRGGNKPPEVPALLKEQKSKKRERPSNLGKRVPPPRPK